jgi:UPF0755 protein
MKYHITKKAGSSKPGLNRILLIGLAVIAALGILGWVVAEQWYKDNLRPVAEQTSEVIFTIEPGQSTRDIARELEEAGIIRDETAFIWYLNRSSTVGDLQAGTYRLDPGQPADVIAQILIEGDVASNLITISPGVRLDQIQTIFERAGFDAGEVAAALSADYNHPLLRFKPSMASLEGYIYPETLQFTAEMSPGEIIERSFDELNDLLTPQLLKQIENQGLTVHEAIILASIVQEEVSDPETRKQVAQVFLRRLDEGISLGADPTFRYAAAVTGQEATPDLDDPYNTRIYPGLPPGPIANFTISALEAVANPADTDYLYFVSGDNGNTYFSRTAEEHQANIDRYCDELCRL